MFARVCELSKYAFLLKLCTPTSFFCSARSSPTVSRLHFRKSDEDVGIADLGRGIEEMTVLFDKTEEIWQRDMCCHTKLLFSREICYYEEEHEERRHAIYRIKSAFYALCSYLLH